MTGRAAPERSAAWLLWGRNLVVWAVILVLLAVTCALSFVPLGPANFPVALSIAAIQVACIAVFSMGLRHSTALVRCALLFAALLILVMFLLVSADVVTRFANHWTR